ncbi:hypothetical protein AUEXF2481DRAFT_596308 [Aureobasidium subglaciale EXF-2481]|uniref:Uncharacterized protein n=1 Tax=Aureobasidium subglaciale (strain EXF-2481) TaxID=1043005 RepID=A0A074YHT8_AURSE|nr:uncharacterized protein AUEXF2481DRAFT_596308 [Aureobasidium subglaciale EXF-2481]KEQ97393.1 hypothetical protein AUEXF2481DRAFT_596308 [Aureobasidium subglaciale EXF-2481]
MVMDMLRVNVVEEVTLERSPKEIASLIPTLTLLFTKSLLISSIFSRKKLPRPAFRNPCCAFTGCSRLLQVLCTFHWLLVLDLSQDSQLGSVPLSDHSSLELPLISSCSHITSQHNSLQRNTSQQSITLDHQHAVQHCTALHCATSNHHSTTVSLLHQSATTLLRHHFLT